MFLNKRHSINTENMKNFNIRIDGVSTQIPYKVKVPVPYEPSITNNDSISLPIFGTVSKLSSRQQSFGDLSKIRDGGANSKRDGLKNIIKI